MRPFYLILLTTFMHVSFAQELIIRFANDSYQIEEIYAKQLRDLASQKIEKIYIEGFTDQNGSDAYNQRLSENRVKSAKNLLISSGLDANKIVSSIGKGKHKDLAISYAEQRCVKITYTVLAELVEQKETVELPKQEIKASKEIPVEKTAPTPTLAEKVSELEVGQKLALHNLTFIPGRRFLMPEAKQHFEELLQILRDNPTLKIEIHGHVCCTPPKEGDGTDLDTGKRNLSVMRAKQVYDMLVYEGIEKERLHFRGFGGSLPLVREINDQTKQMNRRVEILIVER